MKLNEATRELDKKLDEVVGRQERMMSLISQTGVAQGNVPPPAQGQPPPAQGFSDTIRRHEVDAVFNNQNQILNAARELK